MRKISKIKLSVDYTTHGNNKIVSSDEIIKNISELLDDNVKEIIVKKEPTQNVSEENI